MLPPAGFRWEFMSKIPPAAVIRQKHEDGILHQEFKHLGTCPQGIPGLYFK